MSKIKNILFTIIAIGGAIMLASSMYTGDWNLGITGLLSIVIAQLNDIENKLDNKE